jgi:hypothetical protein
VKNRKENTHTLIKLRNLAFDLIFSNAYNKDFAEHKTKNGRDNMPLSGLEILELH